MKRAINGLTLDCAVGDIAAQADLEAVVNAANAMLRPGGGVAGALHRAAGPGLDAECRPLAPIAPGEAVLTGGHDLPNRAVIHCLGPVYGHDEPAADLLADCYRNALALAEGAGLASVGFPAISAGIFGYPLPEAARVAVTTVVAQAPRLKAVRLVRFVLFSRADAAVFEAALAEAALGEAPGEAPGGHSR